MNMQALMKQVQSMQKDMLKAKDEIDAKEFEYKNSIVYVRANGKKEILDIKIESENLELDDIETIQDLLLVAINNVFKQIDEYTEQKMSKYSNIPGLF